MEWLWDVAYWAVIAYAVITGVVFILFFTLWILTIAVIIVAGIATGEWRVPLWIGAAWDIFEELFL